MRAKVTANIIEDNMDYRLFSWRKFFLYVIFGAIANYIAAWYALETFSVKYFQVLLISSVVMTTGWVNLQYWLTKSRLQKEIAANKRLPTGEKIVTLPGGQRYVLYQAEGVTIPVPYAG